MIKRYCVLAIVLVIALPMMAQAGSKRERALANKKKHIEANVPDKSDFDTFMSRDLVSYFKETTGKTYKVEYELLKKDPFQSGKRYPTAYPKYYLWVKMYENDKLVNKGAARVAAVEKKRFEMTYFVDKKKIEEDEDSVWMKFPIVIGTKIIEEKMKE